MLHGQPDYGVPSPPSHPTVVLKDFSYTPASPILVGDTLKLTAKTNRPVADAEMYAHLPALTDKAIEMKDDGQAPDAVANDGVWTAEKTWTAEMGTADNGIVFLILGFHGEYDSQTLQRNLTVLPEEEL